jgi:uncharacterized membrane protein (UPF0127 family)
MLVVNRTRGTYLGIDVRVADSFRARLLGLHAYRELLFGDGVWLRPCNSVQTMGMRWPIDVIFLDVGGRVVRVVEHLDPGHVIWWVSGARSTLELPAGVIDSSETQMGDRIELIRDEGARGRDRDAPYPAGRGRRPLVRGGGAAPDSDGETAPIT